MWVILIGSVVFAAVAFAVGGTRRVSGKPTGTKPDDSRDEESQIDPDTTDDTPDDSDAEGEDEDEDPDATGDNPSDPDDYEADPVVFTHSDVDKKRKRRSARVPVLR